MRSVRSVLLGGLAVAIVAVSACVPTPANPLTSNTPAGALDVVSRSGSSVRVQGWAMDRNTTAPVQVVVSVNDKVAVVSTADRVRDDVARRFGRARVGFDVTVRSVPVGATVCVGAVNVGRGAHSVLGCDTPRPATTTSTTSSTTTTTTTSTTTTSTSTTTTTVPPGPPTHSAAIAFVPNESVASGALDDVHFGDGTTAVNDDFNRPDGPVAAPWMDIGMPLPTVSGNELVAGSTDVSAALIGATSAPFELSAKVAALPQLDAVIVLAVFDNAVGGATARIAVDRFGTVALDLSYPGTTASTTVLRVEAGLDILGKRVAISLNGDGTYTVTVDGVEYVGDPGDVGAIQGTVEGASDLSGCVAHAYSPTTGLLESVAFVASDGSFFIAGVSGGSYRVDVDCNPDGSLWHGGTDFNSATSVTATRPPASIPPLVFD